MSRITTAYFRKVYSKFMKEEISMSRMVEMLNDKASEDIQNCKRCKIELIEESMTFYNGLCTSCFTSNA